MSYNPANAGGASTSATEKWKKHCIYRIPAYTKAQNPGAYSPQSASIGLYHKGESHLKAMEEHKARALDRFRDRSNKSFHQCFEALKDSGKEFISSYHSVGEGKKEEMEVELLKLMVRDGIFLYEFMRGYPDGQGWDYDDQDPVFSVRALPNNPYIVLDILMLENQLPITVLERLIAVEKGDLTRKYHEEVNNLVLKFLSADPPANIANMSEPLGLHVLDISRKVIIKKFEQTDRQQSYNTNISVKSAINLHDAGVKFRKSRDVSFEHATLNLPPLTFETTTEPRFLNAIAFECLHPGTNHEVCSYIAFLQGLIASPSDVEFLRSKDLIESKIGDDQAVYGLMKTMSKNVFFDRSSDLCEVTNSLNKYYKDNMMKWNRRRREWVRALFQKYFKNPWTFSALVAASFLLIFAGFQTVYTMLGYYKGK